jgi:hypothetical protein
MFHVEPEEIRMKWINVGDFLPGYWIVQDLIVRCINIKSEILYLTAHYDGTNWHFDDNRYMEEEKLNKNKDKILIRITHWLIPYEINGEEDNSWL